MPTRNVVLTDRQATLVETLVKEGRYQNASEVLREGLRLLEERDAEHKAKLEAFRAAVQVGLEDLDAGRHVEFHSPKELDEYLRKRANRVLTERRR